MPSLAQAIALAVFVILLAVVVTLVRRLARWLARTRELIAFREAAQDVGRRAEAPLSTISERVDLVRRGALAGEEITAELADAMVLSAGFAFQARQLHPPAGSQLIQTGLVEEFERTWRALEMIDYGCRIKEVGSRREHDPEAQTAIKRGYLNLLHAREAVAGHAAAAAAMTVSAPRFFVRRPPE